MGGGALPQVRAGFEGQGLYEQHLKLGRSGDGELCYKLKNLSVEGGEVPGTMCLESQKLYGVAGSHGGAVWNQTRAGVAAQGLPRALDILVQAVGNHGGGGGVLS